MLIPLTPLACNRIWLRVKHACMDDVHATTMTNSVNVGAQCIGHRMSVYISMPPGTSSASLLKRGRGGRRGSRATLHSVAATRRHVREGDAHARTLHSVRVARHFTASKPSKMTLPSVIKPKARTYLTIPVQDEASDRFCFAAAALFHCASQHGCRH